MVSKTLALLAFSSLTLAKPHGHGHQHQHVARHGREGGRMRPTGGFFPGGNGTWGDAPFPTGSGAGSLPVITQTVVPVPGGGDAQPTGGAAPPVGDGQDKPSPPADQVPSGGEGGAPPADQVPSGGQGDEPTGGDQGEFWGDKDGFQPPPDVNNNVPATPPSNPVSGGQGGGAGGSGNAGGAGGAGNGAPGSNPVSGGQGGGAGNGGGAGGAGNAGGAGGECVPRTETATKVEYVTVTAGSEGASPSNAAGAGGPPAADDQTNLDGAKDPAAGQFFGVPTGGFGGNGQGYGGQHGGQGQGGNQGGAQPVPTTFATMPTGGYGAPSATGGTPAVPTGGNGSGSGNGTTPPSGGSGGGKRGLSYNDAGPLSAFAGTGMTWAYNWADSEGGSLPDGIEYVPMCWGSDSIATCGQKAAGAKHVLSFNEPDLGEQADMTPEAAAQGHIKALNPLAAQGTLIGSPSITNGGAPMGIAWLNNWFKACGGQCKVDFVTFHWYDSANNFEYFKQHVNDVIDAAAQNGVSKVWLTEFGITSGDAASFIQQANAFLDETPAVERYAYFWAAEGALLQGNGLSAAGKAYVA